MSDTARLRRLSAVLLLSATSLAAASCATLLGTRGRNCPNGADLIVHNRSGETVDILLVQEHNEIVLDTAPSGRSVYGPPRLLMMSANNGLQPAPFRCASRRG